MLAEMSARLSAESGDVSKGLRDAHERLQRLLDSARKALRNDEDQARDEAWEEALPNFRSQTLRVLLWGSILNLLVILVRIHLTGMGPLAPMPCSASEPLPSWGDPTLVLISTAVMLRLRRAVDGSRW